MFNSTSSFFPVVNGINPYLLGALVVWSLIWKGFALWKAAAKNNSKIWFIILLIVNSFGILDIIYYLFIGKGGKIKMSEHSAGHDQEKMAS